nr:defensin-like protein 17 isoform X2 [Ipomoea batatas]
MAGSVISKTIFIALFFCFLLIASFGGCWKLLKHRGGGGGGAAAETGYCPRPGEGCVEVQKQGAIPGASRIFVRSLSRHRALFYIKLLCRYAALKMACSSSLGGPPVPRPSEELLGFMSYSGEDSLKSNFHCALFTIPSTFHGVGDDFRDDCSCWLVPIFSSSNEQPEFLLQFGIDLFPVLIQDTWWISWEVMHLSMISLYVMKIVKICIKCEVQYAYEKPCISGWQVWKLLKHREEEVAARTSTVPTRREGAVSRCAILGARAGKTLTMEIADWANAIATENVEKRTL